MWPTILITYELIKKKIQLTEYVVMIGKFTGNKMPHRKRWFKCVAVCVVVSLKVEVKKN